MPMVATEDLVAAPAVLEEEMHPAEDLVVAQAAIVAEETVHTAVTKEDQTMAQAEIIVITVPPAPTEIRVITVPTATTDSGIASSATVPTIPQTIVPTDTKQGLREEKSR